MQTPHATPTGRRKITERMLAARAARPSSYAPVKRGQAMSAAKRAFPVLNVPSRVRELVDVLAGCTKAADWEKGRPIAWPSTSYLCEAMGLGRSQVKALTRQAAEFGLIDMRDAPNGQRWGRREAGDVQEAYGFDLTPILARCAEFEQIAAASAERRREGGKLRRLIGAARNAVLSLCDLAGVTGAAGDWAGVVDQVRQLAQARGDSYDPAELHQILSRLTVLQHDAEEALTPEKPVECAVENDPKEPGNRPLLTPTNPSSFSNENTRAAEPDGLEVSFGATAPRQRTSQEREVATPVVEQDMRKRRRESALRGFVVTPDFIARAIPDLADFTTSRHPGWPELLDAAYLVRGRLGISPHAWGQACVELGRVEALAVLAVIAARSAAGQVQSPGGLLRRMVELHGRGELRLDKSLFGLADAMNETRPGRRQPSEPLVSSSPMQ